jgi:hypothetical protein
MIQSRFLRRFYALQNAAFAALACRVLKEKQMGGV